MTKTKILMFWLFVVLVTCTITVIAVGLSREIEEVERVPQTQYSIVEYESGSCLITLHDQGELLYLNTKSTVLAGMVERDTVLSDYRLVNAKNAEPEWYTIENYQEAKKNLDKYLELKRGGKVKKIHHIEY